MQGLRDTEDGNAHLNGRGGNKPGVARWPTMIDAGLCPYRSQAILFQVAQAHRIKVLCRAAVLAME
jgi:hypothetical protein